MSWLPSLPGLAAVVRSQTRIITPLHSTLRCLQPQHMHSTAQYSTVQPNQTCRLCLMMFGSFTMSSCFMYLPDQRVSFHGRVASACAVQVHSTCQPSPAQQSRLATDFDLILNLQCNMIYPTGFLGHLGQTLLTCLPRQCSAVSTQLQ